VNDSVAEATVDEVDVAPGVVGIDRPTRSPTQIAFAQFRKDKGALIGGAFVVFISLVAIFAPLLTKLEGSSPTSAFPDSLDDTGLPIGSLSGASSSHWLGLQPQIGYDLFARLVYGARVSLGISLSATVLTVGLGAMIGAIAGFFPGKIDQSITALMDLLLAFPSLLFTIALVGIVPDWFPRPLLITLVFSGLGWPYIGRLVRTLVLSLREREFVEAARVSGSGEWRIVFKEILPNLTGPLLTYGTLLIPGYIVAEAGLSFLGVGVKIPTASWGGTLYYASNYYSVDLFFLLGPALALFFTVFAFNLFGDGVAEAFNPKSRR
jgi:ABC-type dipeptide/oligopeptide/nickel transport system permease subunit